VCVCVCVCMCVCECLSERHTTKYVEDRREEVHCEHNIWLMKQQFVITHRYTILQQTEKT